MAEFEEELVRRARKGDRAAFEELVRRTSRLVFARLYLETGDAHRAEDLLQETLLIAFRSLGGLKDPAGFRPWLLRIARNAAIDAARRDLRQKRASPERASPEIIQSLVAGNAQPEDQWAEQEASPLASPAAPCSLPEEYRLPLTLRYITGGDYETICQQLGLTNGSLRGLLHRGLKMLRTKLPAEFGSGP